MPLPRQSFSKAMPGTYDHPSPAERGGGDLGSLFAAIGKSDDLFLFAPAAISRLLHLAAMLADINEAVADYRASGRKDMTLHDTVQLKAYFVSIAIRDVYDALLSEGGTLPVPEGLVGLEPGQVPKRPALVFDEWHTDLE
jgi:hypothetical protein